MARKKKAGRGSNAARRKKAPSKGGGPRARAARSKAQPAAKAPVRIEVDPGECWDLLEVSNSLRALVGQLQPMLAERDRLENILDHRMAKVLTAHGVTLGQHPWTLARTDEGVYLQPYDPKGEPNGGAKKS